MALHQNPPENSDEYSRHFYSLDVLRGVAAFGVAIAHYGLFFCGTLHATSDDPRPPLDFLLMPFYAKGTQAVELFFCLSGFIFFWLYSEKVAGRRISYKKFAVLRFSRLYPLHFVTLLVVAAGQWIMMNHFGDSFIFHNNDSFHFVLQLFFASNWTDQFGRSFNGPIWSVSVEVFLYAMFFLVCILKFNRWWHLILLVMGGHLLERFGQVDLSRGIFSFFLGGLSYLLFIYMWRRGFVRSYCWFFAALTALMWVIVPWGTNHNAFYLVYCNSPLRNILEIHHHDLVGQLLLRLTKLSYTLILFPLTILTLSICEASRGTLGKRLSFFGDVSYSIYLIHFPLMLLLALVVLTFSIPTTIYFSAWVLLGYLGTLLLLSWCSYHFLERPAQRWLRTKLL